MPSNSSIGTVTPVQLVGTVTAAPRGVQLRAAPGQAGIVYVGYANTVTAGGSDSTTGMPLQAGESYFVPPSLITSVLGGIGFASNIWLIASTSSQKVYFDIL